MKTFFEALSNNKDTESFIKELNENIYFCMELSKQSYYDVIKMPLQKFYGYIKWKIKYDEEKNKMIKKKLEEN